MKTLTKKEINQISEHKKIRLWIVTNSFYLFFIIYFTEHIKYSLADFHKEMVELAEDDNIDLLNIISFRWSWKSTILNTAFVIWSILCKPNKKFILLLWKTQNQSKIFLENIKIELETNELLIKDFWLFKHDLSIKKTDIRFNKLNTTIIIWSTKTSLRWMKKWNKRPDLIVCDDLEDTESVWNILNRNRTYNWFKQEVIPLVWEWSKIIILWNYLHKDSLLNIINNEIEDNILKWVSKKYPIVKDNNILWKEKYNSDDIESLKQSIWDTATWRSEFLLMDWTINFEDIEITIVTLDEFWNKIYTNIKDYKE